MQTAAVEPVSVMFLVLIHKWYTNENKLISIFTQVWRKTKHASWKPWKPILTTVTVSLSRRWICRTAKVLAALSPSKDDLSCTSHSSWKSQNTTGICAPVFHRYSEAAAAMEHSCSCCKETRFSHRTIDLMCLNGDSISHTYMHVEACGCGHTECTTPAVQPARRKRSSTLVWQIHLSS